MFVRSRLLSNPCSINFLLNETDEMIRPLRFDFVYFDASNRPLTIVSFPPPLPYQQQIYVEQEDEDDNDEEEEENSTIEFVSTRQRLPDEAVEVLNEWFINNLHNPYPTQDVKARLQRLTGLKRTQVNNWMSGARRKLIRQRKESMEQ